MRIGIDCRLPYYRLGGISQYVIHLLPALAEADPTNEYEVFISRKDNRIYSPVDALNHHSRNVWTPCHHRWERWALAVELLPRRLDVFHSPDFIPPAFGAKRRIITIHDLGFLYYPEHLTPESRRYYSDQIEWAVRVADHIIVDSDYTREDVIERLQAAPGKVTTVYLAANPVYLRPPEPSAVQRTLSQHNLPEGYILFVGTLEPRKNVETLIRAYALLRDEENMDLPLVLIGSKGWFFDDIFVTVEQLGLNSYVHHIDQISDARLAHLYHAAGLLALPSHYEGFGLPPLEAMHSGCPVVVSNRASLPEIVGDAGILLEPNDVTLWAQTMAEVLSDSQVRAEMVTQGLIQAQRFTWSKTAFETFQLYCQAR